ncbi:MAG: hypothetical protein VB092_07240 [Oscillospiraceae bacterium]|nr:hypothetical protein [Oscillospiraceae bacterium]
MNTGKKILSMLLAAILLFSMAAPAFAAAVPSEKEEVIYINLKADGTVEDIYAVNIFGKGDITDYGDYASVGILNTDDEITQNGDTITFTASADRTYYEGKMKTTDIPWNISISYFMDEKQYSADEIAGKSGRLKICFRVTENTACGGGFFDGYALQAAFTLDTDRCSGIAAPGATIANVGKDKQLSYTILPGEGIDAVITANVTDFEMDAVSINGIPLSLSVELDDAELQDKIDELIGAVADLDQGAADLNDGAQALSGAMDALSEKTVELNSGTGRIAGGAADLYGGLSALAAQNDPLTGAAWSAYVGLCSASEEVLNAQLSANGLSAVTLTPETYSAVLQGVLAQLGADEIYAQAYKSALQTVSAQVDQQAEALYAGYIQANADSIYLAYVHGQAQALYAQVAAQAILEQLVSDGTMDRQQAEAWLQTAEGEAQVARTVANMSEEQKSQIISGAVAGLSDAEKQQILQGALASLTDEQKTQIRSAYIQQQMAGDEVTAGITAAVAQSGEAAARVAELKGQLDSYGAFYKALKEYTDAVGSAADGANALKLNLDTLYESTGRLNASVGQLDAAVKELYAGTDEMKDGTGKFADETADMRGQVDEQIDSMLESLTGDTAEVVSFVSEKNTYVDSVQFVLQTEAVKSQQIDSAGSVTEGPLTFVQKLLRLFGLY